MLQIKRFLPQNATFVLNPLCLALFLGVIQRTIRKHDISVLQKRDPNLLPDYQHERLMRAALWVVLFVRLSCLLQMVLTAVLRTFMVRVELALFLIMCSSRKPTNSRDCICPKQTKDLKWRAKPSLQRIPCLVGGPVDCTLSVTRVLTHNAFWMTQFSCSVLSFVFLCEQQGAIDFPWLNLKVKYFIHSSSFFPNSQQWPSSCADICELWARPCPH